MQTSRQVYKHVMSLLALHGVDRITRQTMNLYGKEIYSASSSDSKMTASQKQAAIHCLTKFLSLDMSLDTRCGFAKGGLMPEQGCMAQNISRM